MDAYGSTGTTPGLILVEGGVRMNGSEPDEEGDSGSEQKENGSSAIFSDLKIRDGDRRAI